jgi:hypothetical protein
MIAHSIVGSGAALLGVGQAGRIAVVLMTPTLVFRAEAMTSTPNQSLQEQPNHYPLVLPVGNPLQMLAASQQAVRAMARLAHQAQQSPAA